MRKYINKYRSLGLKYITKNIYMLLNGKKLSPITAKRLHFFIFQTKYFFL